MRFRSVVSRAMGLAAALSLVAGAVRPISAQEAKGTIEVNGKKGSFRYAYAMEVDSKSEPGYLDVRVVLSDRELTAADLRDDERLERMSREKGLVALVVVLNPDARVMSAEPLHPAFTTIISSGVFVSWEPSAYDDNVAGRFFTDGLQESFSQKWQYDVTFSTPIELDPEATTVD